MTSNHQKSDTEQGSQGLTNLSIVIPFFNEARNLALVAKDVQYALAGLPCAFELILCDDGSTDGGLTEALRIRDTMPNVRVLTSRINQGQAVACIAGIVAAKGAWIAMMDGDGQNPAENIVALFHALQTDSTFVKGYRTNRQDDFATRVLPSAVGNWLLSILSGVSIRDLGCSLAIYRRSALMQLPACANVHRYMGVLLAWQGKQFEQIPVSHHRRFSGNSKYSQFAKIWGLAQEFRRVYLLRGSPESSRTAIGDFDHKFTEVPPSCVA